MSEKGTNMSEKGTNMSEKGTNMSEKNDRVKIVEIKDMHVENLKIKGFGEKTIIIKNLTLKNVRLIFKLPSEKLEKKE